MKAGRSRFMSFKLSRKIQKRKKVFSNDAATDTEKEKAEEKDKGGGGARGALRRFFGCRWWSTRR